MAKEHLFSITKKDFKVETYKASGKGGQNRNKRETAVRITHPPSGAVGMCADERTQEQNKKIAFRRLTESTKFNHWLKIKSSEVLGNRKTPEEIRKEVELEVENDLREGRIRIDEI